MQLVNKQRSYVLGLHRAVWHVFFMVLTEENWEQVEEFFRQPLEGTCFTTIRVSGNQLDLADLPRSHLIAVDDATTATLLRLSLPVENVQT